MQDYSLYIRVEVMIYATLINAHAHTRKHRQTDRQTDRQFPRAFPPRNLHQLSATAHWLPVIIKISIRIYIGSLSWFDDKRQFAVEVVLKSRRTAFLVTQPGVETVEGQWLEVGVELVGEELTPPYELR